MYRNPIVRRGVAFTERVVNVEGNSEKISPHPKTRPREQVNRIGSVRNCSHAAIASP